MSYNSPYKFKQDFLKIEKNIAFSKVISSLDQENSAINKVLSLQEKQQKIIKFTPSKNNTIDQDYKSPSSNGKYQT